jgi:hypothetical protein
MTSWAVTLGGLAVAGAVVGGSIAWIATSPTDAPPPPEPAHAPAAVSLPVEADDHTGDADAHDDVHTHDLDDFSDTPEPGRQVDVWVDEPPLGPVPDADPQPAVPEDAVRGYLAAAHTVTADDATIRHRRHHPWLHPDAPGRTGGMWTLDPPDEGVTRNVEVMALEHVVTAEAGTVWQVRYELWDGEERHAERTRYVTTRQVPAGHWLVVAETVELEPIAH